MMKKVIFYFAIIAFPVFIISCNPNPKPGTDLSVEADSNAFELDEDTYYQIPSPEELFAFVQDGDLQYNSALLNPIENISKYTDTKLKELNFGVYSADLAYAAAFKRYQESSKGIETVRKLSQDLEISSVFDQELNKKLEYVFENSDSLLSVTTTTYYKIVKYLENNERNRTLALIISGGYIESLYIFANLINDFDKQKNSVQRLADQKLTFSNLKSYLNSHATDESIKSVLTDIEPLSKIFESLQSVEVAPVEKKVEQTNAFVVGGNKKIEISKEQFELLKKELTALRNKISAN